MVKITAANDAASERIAKEQAQMQVYFEVEVNGMDVIYLENVAASAGRKKVSLQLVGAQTVTMRTRSLVTQHGLTITVANPRMVVLISPTSFSVPVVSKLVDVGKRKSVPLFE